MATSTSGASGTTSTGNTLTFTGTSLYSKDFQNVITRAVAIASLPITLLDNEVTSLNSQTTALNTLNTDFTNLSNAVDAVTTAMGASAFNVDVSAPTTVSAAVSDGAMQGSYSIQVDNLGAYSTAQSADTGNTKVTDPTTQNISAATNYTLHVGSSSYSITPSSDTLYDLADAINSSSAGVQATVVNLGSSSSPDYRLSLQNAQLGDVAIDLDANTADSSGKPVSATVMGTGVEGSLASYQVNGSTEVATSDSRTVTIAPGLDVTMLATTPSGQPTSITLTRQSETIASALQSLVTAYNTAQTDVNAQRGDSGGALSGQSIVYELQDALNQIGTYDQPGSSVSSLSDLGITFDKTTFQMDFDETGFLSAALGNMDGIASFLGDGTSSGFLLTASNAMSSVEDPTQGSLPNAIADNQTEINNDNNRISTEQAQINVMQTNLINQMDAADSLISSMEQQYTVVSDLFTAMDGTTASTAGTPTNTLA
jgi:flagellar hook-associated protein 2